MQRGMKWQGCRREKDGLGCPLSPVLDLGQARPPLEVADKQVLHGAVGAAGQQHRDGCGGVVFWEVWGVGDPLQLLIMRRDRVQPRCCCSGDTPETPAPL